MTPTPPSFFDMSLADIEALMKASGEPAYRAQQVYRQIYLDLAEDPATMTNLPQALRKRLSADARMGDLDLVKVQTSDGGMTRKALFRVSANAPVEAVLMVYPERATVCVSTQSGCAVGCSFCATGKLGFTLNLTPGQMIEQVLWAARELNNIGGGAMRLSNIVYMGMGEPFNNYDRWWASVERLHDPKGFNMSARGFTVSTVGIVPGIRRLAREELPVNLAVSLHAPDDELRNRLAPINKRYPIAALIEAVRDYTAETHRRVSFEYVLMEGVNDSPEQALRLARLLRGEKKPLLCHVNLIPWNPVPGVPVVPSARRRVLAFEAALQKHHVPCTLRVQRGVDIAAACGQLAGRRA
jgi:23S rRNA (adenine2503-C2)-methyltransferase